MMRDKAIFNSHKFNNQTKLIKIYSLHGDNEVIFNEVIEDDVIRDGIIKAIRQAEAAGYRDAISHAKSLLNTMKAY